MKQEYKERAMNNLETIAKRVTVMEEMNSGKRPSNKQQVDTMIQEMKRLIDSTYNILDVS